MIIVRVMGGTGNQMFQYALARKLKEMNKYVVLDISAYKTWEFRYDFCLNRIFDINKDIYITEDPNEFIIKNCRNIKIIDCENQPYYNADILNYDNVYLNGYWMSEKYFKDIEKILRKEFIFKNTLDKEKSELVNELKNTNSVGIHVRRGDYLQGNAANIFTGITTKKYYDNSFIGYSYSKSLSLPGERIGYVVVNPKINGFKEIVSSLNIANRILGFVNAPSLFQKVIKESLNLEVDAEIYKKNRDLLYNHLISIGFECMKPEGAFYLFPKAPINDDVKFCEEAKKFNILAVPGKTFGCPGYFRLSYCISYEKIKKSLKAFDNLMEKYKK